MNIIANLRARAICEIMEDMNISQNAGGRNVSPAEIEDSATEKYVILLGQSHAALKDGKPAEVVINSLLQEGTTEDTATKLVEALTE